MHEMKQFCVHAKQATWKRSYLNCVFKTLRIKLLNGCLIVSQLAILMLALFQPT